MRCWTSIPPRAPQPHRSGCGRGCCCRLFSLVFKIILAIVVILALAILIFWLVVRPNEIKVHVTDASLSSFIFANNSNNLNYNLSLTVSIRNPNRKIGVYYDKIETSAYYEYQRIQTVWLPTFYQGHKSTTDLKAVMYGQTLVLLDAEEQSEFNMQSGTGGVYSIDVKLRMDIRLKVSSVTVGKFEPKVNCDLKLPLNANGNQVSGFTPTRCSFDF